MCDLLGLSFNRPVNARISLDVFQQAGRENPDGWGVAVYPRGHLQIYKEPRPAVSSKLYDFVESHLESSIFISHVRRTTRGRVSYLNTHPFYRQVKWNDHFVEFTLAHNGTLVDLNGLETGNYVPLGDTDSEYLLCHLLNYFESFGIEGWNDHIFKKLELHLREINHGSNTLNCIFSDGTYLFCYSDIWAHNGGLHFVKRQFPFGTVHLKREEGELGSVLVSVNLDEQKARDSVGHIVSTERLTYENWQPIGDGHLLVLKDGQPVYHS
ncbi:MAG: class II glutamine amidotransferase [Candidatus Thorarchaeota archaeon]